MLLSPTVNNDLTSVYYVCKVKNCTDAQLIELIKESDHGAFHELHRRYWHPLFRQVCTKIGDADEADDLLQEMFIGIWEKRQELQFNNAVESWLRNRVWFRISSYFRAKGFTEKHLENFRQFLEQETEASATTGQLLHSEADETYEEILAVISTGISEMPEKMQEIFRLSSSGKYSVREIADKLDLSPHTVKKQLERARARLKKLATAHRFDTVEYLFILWLINR